MAHLTPTSSRISHEQVIRRIDGLVNKVTLAVSAVKARYCLIKEVHDEEGVHLHVRLRMHAWDDVSESEASTTEEGRKAVLSYNACTMVARYFSGLVAFLVEKNELPIAVSEAHIYGVVPEKTIRMYCEEEYTADLANIHTMLKFTSTDPSLHSLLGTGGAYTDASSWQYWREQSLCKVWGYPVKQPMANYLHNKDNALGTEYQDQLTQFVEGRSHPPDTHREHVNATEARIRTMNNALYDMVMELGGPKYISMAGDTAWRVAEEQLVRTAAAAAQNMEVDGDWAVVADTYQRKADEALSAGHRAFVAALDCASELDLAELLSQ
ncbi:hypothetical protein T440DRAFT_530739 [Plenodomus tracheiphilus IPT5]|uniref:Uncharacterized protein n=1 Tax=Plenodomus tracheiphilus IPT5 TaxID=1408161 RepID=A0A6A7B740_9PLEO|nr:hypothetical protein T440DRAFT_530739 [Plenodomus tracheiphilus IPT5]